MLFHSEVLTSLSMTVQTSRAFGKSLLLTKDKALHTQCDDHFVNWDLPHFQHDSLSRDTSHHRSRRGLSSRGRTSRVSQSVLGRIVTVLILLTLIITFSFSPLGQKSIRAPMTRNSLVIKKANTLRRTFIISSASKSFTFEDTSIAVLTPSAASPCVAPSASSFTNSSVFLNCRLRCPTKFQQWQKCSCRWVLKSRCAVRTDRLPSREIWDTISRHT